jgi:hypothetical protein
VSETTTAPAASTGLLSREAIRAVNDTAYEIVHCPEWGGSVRLRGLTGRERDEFEAGSLKGRGKNVQMNLANMRARLVAMAAVDGDGNQLFAGEDVSWLGRKSAVALERCFQAARRLSGLTDGDVEELAANFGDDPNGSSTSG